MGAKQAGIAGGAQSFTCSSGAGALATRRRGTTPAHTGCVTSSIDSSERTRSRAPAATPSPNRGATSDVNFSSSCAVDTGFSGLPTGKSLADAVWSAQRPLNAQNQTYYIAPTYYEWNVFELFQRKIEASLRADIELFGGQGEPLFHQANGKLVSYELASADRLSHLGDDSVDYVFTDPPFGSNIFYSDMSRFHEAWLGRTTDNATDKKRAHAPQHDHPDHDRNSVDHEPRRAPTRHDAFA